MRVAVTGGTGFIAKGAIEAFSGAGIACRAISRFHRQHWVDDALEWVTISSYDDARELIRALSNVDCIIHLAANSDRTAAHDVEEASAQAAALISAQRACGVKRTIFASSVYARMAAAAEAYGKVKLAVENQFLGARDLQSVILRLPPVYGPGGKGGVQTLARMVQQRLPLPLGSATAERAYLSRANLTSLLVAIVSANDVQWQSAAGNIFEPSDGTTISTRDLACVIASELEMPLRMVSVPAILLQILAKASGKSNFISGAFDALTVPPIEALDHAFGWRPTECMPQSLRFLSQTSVS